MKLFVVGGPFCGEPVDVPLERIQEGQIVRVRNVDHIFNKPSNKIGRLIYYPKLKEE